MLMIPAIDLQRGKCVRLKQGQFDRVSIYEPTPMALAEKYAKQEASRLHIVDLDGAKSGNIEQLEIIKEIKACGLSLQVGGGIRSIATALSCLEAGIDRLVIGSIAISDPQTTLQIIEQATPEKIIIAVDVNMVEGIPVPAIHGWQTTTNKTLWEVASFYQQVGIKEILCTDIVCDGMMSGPSFSLYEEACTRFPGINWQASGGIRHLEDIKKLKSLGIAAVILGRMLYETEFDLKAL